MYNEDIEKIFNLEVREKKRIGSNIFKRVSTRKGKSNMSSMRVPTQKEQRLLSGKMEVFNLNEIISYEEFLKKDEKDQRLLITHWRSKYSNREIARTMGIDNNRFYRIMVRLGVIIPNQRQDKKTVLSEETLQKILNDDNLIEFSKFQSLALEQQIKILDDYIHRYEDNQTLLADKWKGAYVAYLYGVRNRYKNKMKSLGKNSVVVNQEKLPLPEVTDTKEETIETKPETIETIETTPVESVSVETENKHQVNIIMDKEKEEEVFSFKLKGSYNKDSIIRRLNMLIIELEETEDKLKIDLSIEG